MDEEKKFSSIEMLAMVSRIVCAYLGNTNISGSQIPLIINATFKTLGDLGAHHSNAAGQEPEILKAAVPVKRSVTPDYIICLEDGRKLRMLKRHLRSTYGLSPDEYRARWNLPNDYPMVAPNYAKQRSEFAKKIGLGHSARAGGRRKTSVS